MTCMLKWLECSVPTSPTWTRCNGWTRGTDLWGGTYIVGSEVASLDSCCSFSSCLNVFTVKCWEESSYCWIISRPWIGWRRQLFITWLDWPCAVSAWRGVSWGPVTVGRSRTLSPRPVPVLMVAPAGSSREAVGGTVAPPTWTSSSGFQELPPSMVLGFPKGSPSRTKAGATVFIRPGLGNHVIIVAVFRVQGEERQRPFLSGRSDRNLQPNIFDQPFSKADGLIYFTFYMLYRKYYNIPIKCGVSQGGCCQNM